MTHIKLTKLSAALAATALIASVSQGAPDDDIAALREQIRALDQKLRVLERKAEIKDEEFAAAAKAAPKITVNDKGVTLASGDGANSIKIRGLVQADSRWFLNDQPSKPNAFVLRRARIILEGAFAKKFEYQVVPEFAGSAFTILDANVAYNYKPEFGIRVGKFKSPLGLEQLQSDAWAFFSERSIVSGLVPNRDIGVQVFGDLLDGRLTYQAALVNGLGDGGSTTTNTDFDTDKDVVGRVFAHPFKNSEGPLKGLGIGVAGSVGREKTASALTGGYRSDGQQTIFAYRSTVVNDGQTWRLSPQAYYYNGPLGLLAEYVVSTNNVRTSPVAPKAEISNKAWQVAAGWVLTGEDSSFKGVVPRTNFDPANGTWGAFEVVARVAGLDIDDAAYPVYADPATAVSGTTSYAAGVNWYLSKAVRFNLHYFHTEFDSFRNATLTRGNVQKDEQAVITRLQLTF